MTHPEKIQYEFAKTGTVVMNETIQNIRIHDYYSSIDFERVLVDKQYGKDMLNEISDLCRLEENKEYIKEIKHLYIIEFEAGNILIHVN